MCSGFLRVFIFILPINNNVNLRMLLFELLLRTIKKDQKVVSPPCS